MDYFAPEAVHEPLLRNAPRVLRFDASKDYAVWRKAVRRKLRQLLGVMPSPVPPEVRVEWEQSREQDDTAFTERRFIFTSEAFADVPCHLLIPKTGRKPFPVVICLQGHSTGMHISLGRTKFEGDEKSLGGDRDFGIQAVRRGYAALVMEQRCFGERQDSRDEPMRGLKHTCHHASMVALLLGRTMIGERLWDVSRAIDVLRTFPEVDGRRIACMGNSGGGTITYFAACLERRISVAMPSCYVCTFKDSIGSIDHCPDNYIPGILRWFEMGDLACLIAPRPLIVVAGKHDDIFPFHAVEETFETIKEIYRAAGAPDRCSLIVGEEGHRFYAAQAWPEFRRLARW